MSLSFLSHKPEQFFISKADSPSVPITPLLQKDFSAWKDKQSEGSQRWVETNNFSAKPGEPNAYGLIGFVANEIQPFKRPLSSMSPTFMIGEDKRAVIGTPGGSRIITMVLLGILDFMAGNEPESWVSLPRFHHQYEPDKISAEADAFSAEEIAALEALGHKVEVRERPWGNMHGAMWNRKTGEVTAGSDPRWPSGRAIVK